jgi:polyhydroxyalkanoate synthase
MGLVVGRTAAKTTVPKIIDFLRGRSEAVGADSQIAEAAEAAGSAR